MLRLFCLNNKINIKFFVVRGKVMNREKISNILKSKWFPCVLTGIICLGVGGSASASAEQELSKAKETIKSNESQITDLNNEISGLKGNIDSLQSKVDKAKPFFEMDAAQQEALSIEAKRKEEENKKEAERLEAEKKAEEERLEKEKAEKEEAERLAKLEERSVTLGNGTYLVGKDIPEGVYDLVAVKGGGNVISSRQVNVIMGVRGDENFYQREQQNVALKDGTNIELRNVTVKFIPDDGYVIKK